jgi:hypothetical protein
VFLIGRVDRFYLTEIHGKRIAKVVRDCGRIG